MVNIIGIYPVMTWVGSPMLSYVSIVCAVKP
jgi:hypothetical protein